MNEQTTLAENRAAMRAQAPVETTDRDRWLEERRKSIGASEVPTVLGLNPWDTPLQLALRKRGELPDKEETEAMRMGHKLEPVVAELYVEETGRAMQDPGEYAIQRNPDHPFLHATLDRLVWMVPDHPKDPDRWDTAGDLQIKTVGAHMADRWEGVVPLGVQCQVQAEMAVAKLSWGSVAALIGGQQFVWKDIERNDSFIAHMVDVVGTFWDMVQAGDLPTAEAEDKKALRLLWPEHKPAKVVSLPPDAIDWDCNRQHAGEQIKIWEGRKERAEAQLQQAIGDAEIGELPNGDGRYSWKASERKGYEVKPTTTRTLRRLKT